MNIHFDGNPFEMCTIGVAALSVFFRPLRRKLRNKERCFVFHDVVVDFLNGTVIVPFLLLIGATFSKELLDEALRTDKVFFAIGGGIALLFVLREYVNRD